MKILFISLFTFLTLSKTTAAPVAIKDYDWKVTDVAELGLKKEEIFLGLDRKFIKLGNSICANRALMWLHDLKKEHNIDGAKIFLFYTEKTGGAGLRSWWYHVAPIIAENNDLYVIDAGFRSIKNVMKVKDWVGTFSVGAKCKEIQAHETDLIELMNSGRQFPTTTHYGTYDCYYKVVPAGLWFPTSVATSLMGGNISNEIQEDEVYSACTEATTSPIGRHLGFKRKQCKRFSSY
jgi:hypothetical protein